MMTLLAHHSPAADPQGPPVVLLHGFTSAAEVDFPGWADRLDRESRTCLAVELPGHGGNEPIASPEDAGTAAIIAEIIDTIDEHLPKGEEIDVVGYSLGARLAWELPGRLDRIRRIVLGGLSPMEPFAAVTADGLLSAVGAEAPADPITGMLAGMISAPGADAPSLARLAEGLGRQPFSPESNAPTCPTLFLAGTEDPMSEGIDVLSEAVPGSRLERVPGDHLSALHSEEFLTAALEFLRA